MKKFVTLFTDSYRELKSVRTVTTSAMFAAIAMVLGMFTITMGNYIKIGFSSIPNGIISYLFGPVTGSVFAGTLDVLKYIMKPTGAFFPGFTLVAILGGLLYGCFYYKRPITFVRVLAAKFTVMLICNLLLNTLCLSILYGKGFMVLLPPRIIKNLVMWPIDSIVFYSIVKALDGVGVLKSLQRFTTARAK